MRRERRAHLDRRGVRPLAFVANGGSRRRRRFRKVPRAVAAPDMEARRQQAGCFRVEDFAVDEHGRTACARFLGRARGQRKKTQKPEEKSRRFHGEGMGREVGTASNDPRVGAITRRLEAKPLNLGLYFREEVTSAWEQDMGLVKCPGGLLRVSYSASGRPATSGTGSCPPPQAQFPNRNADPRQNPCHATRGHYQRPDKQIGVARR